MVNQPQAPTEPPTGAALVRDHVQVDLSAPATFDDGVPFDAFAVLRRHAPVAWHDETVDDVGGWEPSPGFWSVTSHASVTEVSRRPDVFSSWLGSTSIGTPDELNLAVTRQMMLNMDPPDHSRLRRILQPMFTPRAVQRLVDSVRSNAREIVDDLVAGPDHIDLVTAASAELPLRVLADLLGVPREDRHLMFEWSNAIVGMADPEYGGDRESVVGVVTDMLLYGTELANDRKAMPRDDVVSLICNAETADGERLTDGELSMFWLLLVIAGNETTRNSISGSVVALLEHGLWDALRTEPGLRATATDELLRYVSPVLQFRRTATTDTILDGQHIRAGDKVVVWYASANRDEAEFPAPDQLDLRRDPNRHVAFGTGPHFCLGSHLGRLQLSTFLNELTGRLPDLHLTGTVERMRSNFINGIRHLPVSLVGDQGNLAAPAR